eukprot:m.35136 g.35136  ORF g.35136 m.35136 type:complete len:103 (+) comp32070_c0_seq1:105-413(+)
MVGWRTTTLAVPPLPWGMPKNAELLLAKRKVIESVATSVAYTVSTVSPGPIVELTKTVGQNRLKSKAGAYCSASVVLGVIQLPTKISRTAFMATEPERNILE